MTSLTDVNCAKEFLDSEIFPKAIQYVLSDTEEGLTKEDFQQIIEAFYQILLHIPRSFDHLFQNQQIMEQIEISSQYLPLIFHFIEKLVKKKNDFETFEDFDLFLIRFLALFFNENQQQSLLLLENAIQHQYITKDTFPQLFDSIVDHLPSNIKRFQKRKTETIQLDDSLLLALSSVLEFCQWILLYFDHLSHLFSELDQQSMVELFLDYYDFYLSPLQVCFLKEKETYETLQKIKYELLKVFVLLLQKALLKKSEISNWKTILTEHFLKYKETLSETSFESLQSIEFGLLENCSILVDASCQPFQLLTLLSEQLEHCPDLTLLIDTLTQAFNDVPFKYFPSFIKRPLPELPMTSQSDYQEKIQEVQSILPHLDQSFVFKCLKYFDFSVDRTIQALLDSNIPDQLLDNVEVKKKENDILDIKELSQQHKEAVLKYQEESEEDDGDEEEEEINIKHLNIKNSLEEEVEEEEELEYDYDFESESEKEIKPVKKEENYDSILFNYYTSNPEIFERFNRKNPKRAELKNLLKWTDEQIEGWKSMLERDPKKYERMNQLEMDSVFNHRNQPIEKVPSSQQPSSQSTRGRGRGRVRGKHQDQKRQRGRDRKQNIQKAFN